MRFILPAALIIFLVSPLVAVAQFVGSTSAFSISLDPQYPAPYSQSTLSVLSSAVDITNATIAVSVAGKEIYRGNVRPVAIPLGKAGRVTNARVTVLSSGTNYSQTLSIQPQDVSLIVEPVSSTHPLYQGKSFVPLEGSVRVVAMANVRNASGKALDPANLSYSWMVDDTRITGSSGIGKNVLIVASPLEYRSRSVSVIVKSQDGTLTGGASISFTAMQPLVRIYKNDPLLGILYGHTLSDHYAVNEAEETLYAVPFSLPISNGIPFLQWFLSGSAVQEGNSITLRPTGSGHGTASLSLVASAGESTRATENLSLSFGEAPSGFGLFGL
ncbi:MAG: hypothetical protein V1711_00525 [bacterium]